MVTVDGRPVRIRNFEFSGLRTECDGGAIVYVRRSIARIRVRDDRNFAKTVERNGKRIRVTGKVRRNGVVPGTIRASGDYGQQTNCDSGRIAWIAERN